MSAKIYKGARKLRRRRRLPARVSGQTPAPRVQSESRDALSVATFLKRLLLCFDIGHLLNVAQHA